jgi:hypothetical protein
MTPWRATPNMGRMRKQFTLKESREFERLAAHYGDKAGAGAAAFESQYLWGGRQTDNKAAILTAKAVLEGDALETMSPPNLSGEWAGEFTDTKVMAMIGNEIGLDDTMFTDDLWCEMKDHVASIWEENATTGYVRQLEQEAKAFLEE